jgi:hypothetical protein
MWELGGRRAERKRAHQVIARIAPSGDNRSLFTRQLRRNDCDSIRGGRDWHQTKYIKSARLARLSWRIRSRLNCKAVAKECRKGQEEEEWESAKAQIPTAADAHYRLYRLSPLVEGSLE